MTELQDLTAVELVDALRRKEVSAREALDAHFARVDAVNPAINAVVTQVRQPRPTTCPSCTACR